MNPEDNTINLNRPIRFLERVNVLRLNLEDEKINFKWSNQIARKWRIYRLDWGRLENHLKLANIVALDREKFSRSS